MGSPLGSFRIDDFPDGRDGEVVLLGQGVERGTPAAFRPDGFVAPVQRLPGAGDFPPSPMGCPLGGDIEVASLDIVLQLLQ